MMFLVYVVALCSLVYVQPFCVRNLGFSQSTSRTPSRHLDVSMNFFDDLKIIFSKEGKESMNFFDDLKIIFSKEGKDGIKKYNEREKEEMMAAQKEILERRNNPKKMRQYEAEREAKRMELAEERAVYKFQRETNKGDKYDPLTDWKRLKDEGKVKIGKDLKRDEGSSRLGSEGLYDVRVDERMPYIDQGYVDEDADVMGKLMGMFGKKKNKDENTE
eukprot:CAMPEP_0174991260 /NCGR_PEP_ID=MMETSP0004_2-20121128/21795_1 /TAXON_ID=420556 /ORGANISM="Ochromonas sp., Strain CCMP1393" /LENGTH=216 /DNA_ID=CAMNT_0016244993 /DNA_START=1 /DNA_END=651 /DNA_ORIENTATION=+